MQVLDTGVAEAQVNMSRDRDLLDDLNPNGVPILHYYDWVGPSATYGHFIDISKHMDLQKTGCRGLELARRPTGGGIVFHMWDLAFSFLMPANHPACSANTLDNYRFVNEVVLDAVKASLSLPEEPLLTPQHAPEIGPNCTHFCMARPTIYDVVYRGMKVAGAAQRRTKRGYLHQGTISLAFPDLALLKEVLLSKEEIAYAMESYAFAPLGREWTLDKLRETRLLLKEALKCEFMRRFEELRSLSR